MASGAAAAAAAGDTGDDGGADDEQAAGGGGGALTSLTALKGRKITLNEILSSLDQVKHWPAPGQDEGAPQYTYAAGASRRSVVSGTRGSSTGRTTTDVRAQQDEDIRRTAARAASIHSKPGSIQQETGTASRVAAASEAVMRARERTKAYEERSRRLSAGSSVCSSGSGGSSRFRSTSNHSPSCCGGGSTTNTPRSVGSRATYSTPRSDAQRFTPRSGYSMFSTPRSGVGSSSSPDHNRSERIIRPRNPLGMDALPLPRGVSPTLSRHLSTPTRGYRDRS